MGYFLFRKDVRFPWDNNITSLTRAKSWTKSDVIEVMVYRKCLSMFVFSNIL